jgi:hypothetical protein
MKKKKAQKKRKTPDPKLEVYRTGRTIHASGYIADFHD